jgi:hypothetical protein
MLCPARQKSAVVSATIAGPLDAGLRAIPPADI